MRNAVIAVAAFSTFLISVAIHDPRGLAQYTDYLAIFFRDPDRTVRGIPYVDYMFEYPPLIAAIWFLEARAGLPSYLASGDPWQSFEQVMAAVYAATALFYTIYVVSVLGISKGLGSGTLEIILAVASPSMAYYLVYNWDIVASSLLSLGLLALMRGRLLASSVILGLAASSKIFPGVAVLSVFMYLLKETPRRGLLFLATGSGAAAAPYALLLAINPQGFWWIIHYHSSWYCENCFYIVFVGDIFDPAARHVSQILVVAAPLLLASRILSKCRGYSSPVGASLASVPLSIGLSYIYSPQMNIMISPLYTVLRKPLTTILLAQDSLNAAIMVLWFHEAEIASVLGIESRGPWHRESPVQWIAFARALLLLLTLAVIAARPHVLKGLECARRGAETP